MLIFYQWLQSRLPLPLVNLIMVVIYTGLILLTLALSDTRSSDFIYWDQ